MKIRRKMSKAALTTLICLALSGSALAMPSGGEQVQGNVSISNGSLAAVANGATITVNGSSIINWQDFGIKNNEKLNIDTTNGALLNRVTSSKVSEILGTLTQKGNNPLLLVNPNGIVVGGGATINASNMVLSALAIDNDNFNKFITKSNADIFVGSNEMGGKIDIQKGAKLNVDEALSMLGGTVNVADGVTFSLDNGNVNNGTVNFIASNKATMGYEDGEGEIKASGFSPKEDNELTFNGSLVQKRTSVFNRGFDENFCGGKINFTNASLDSNANVNIISGTMAADGDIITATKGNSIKADNLTIKNAESVWILGSSVDLNNVDFSRDANCYSYGNYTVLAVNKCADTAEYELKLNADANNSININNSNIINNKDRDIALLGGKIAIKNSKIGGAEGSNDTPVIYAVAGNNITMNFNDDGRIGTLSGAGKNNMATYDDATQFITSADKLHLNNLKLQDASKPEPTPEPTPEPAPEPTPTPVPEFSQQDKANIAAGSDIAKGILGDSANQTLADCQQSFSKYVADLDAKAGSERAKAGQVLGILDAIKSDDSITLAEKQVLQLTVLNAYTPVKQAEQYNENVMTKANKMPEVNNQIEKAVKAIANTKDVQSVVEVEK